VPDMQSSWAANFTYREVVKAVDIGLSCRIRHQRQRDRRGSARLNNALADLIRGLQLACPAPTLRMHQE
jgi:hypothetical protein